jgi:hypothetical protein
VDLEVAELATLSNLREAYCLAMYVSKLLNLESTLL